MYSPLGNIKLNIHLQLG